MSKVFSLIFYALWLILLSLMLDNLGVTYANGITTYGATDNIIDGFIVFGKILFGMMTFSIDGFPALASLCLFYLPTIGLIYILVKG